MNNHRSNFRSFYLVVILVAFISFLILLSPPRPADGRRHQLTAAETILPNSVDNPQDEEEHTLFLPLLANSYCAPYVDDFSDEGSGWPAGENNDLIFGYFSGEYQIRTKRSGDFYLFASPACPRDNHVVEVDLRWQDDPGQVAGLIFDLKDNFEQFYLFGINSQDQTYVLEYYGAEGWILLIQNRKSDAIRPDQESNHLKVTRIGDNIVLEINGTIVDRLNDNRVAGSGRTGLYTFPFRNRPQSDARFDNFSSRNLAQNGKAAPALHASLSQMMESKDWLKDLEIRKADSFQPNS